MGSHCLWNKDSGLLQGYIFWEGPFTEAALCEWKLVGITMFGPKDPTQGTCVGRRVILSDPRIPLDKET